MIHSSVSQLFLSHCREPLAPRELRAHACTVVVVSSGNTSIYRTEPVPQPVSVVDNK